jgi:hypothetical protein
MVITAPLPDSVVRNGEVVRQVQERAAWRERKLRGEVSEGEEPPSVPSVSEDYVMAGLAGAAVWLVLGLLVQLVAEGLGNLFGFHPGLVGLEVGFPGGIAASVGTLMWRDRARSRDAKMLAANQREIRDPADRAQMMDAHWEVMMVARLWPEIPLDEGPAEPRLHTALWGLSELLAARRQFADVLAKLREAQVGVPRDSLAAQRLSQQIKQADPLHRSSDEAVRQHVERLTVLATRCKRYCDEQAAIERAQHVSRQAHAVLGPFLVADRASGDDVRAFQEHLDSIRETYRSLPEVMVPTADGQAKRSS